MILHKRYPFIIYMFGLDREQGSHPNKRNIKHNCKKLLLYECILLRQRWTDMAKPNNQRGGGLF